MQDEEKNREYIALVRANQNKLNAFIFCMVPVYQDAEDILQDALSEIWMKFDQYERGTSFLAWAFSIARFKILNYRRKNKNSKVQFSDKLIDIFQNELRERICEIETKIDKLKECVRELSSRETALLRFRYQEDLTFRQIASIYGYSHQAICKSMSIIHSRLVDCINRKKLCNG